MWILRKQLELNLQSKISFDQPILEKHNHQTCGAFNQQKLEQLHHQNWGVNHDRTIWNHVTIKNVDLTITILIYLTIKFWIISNLDNVTIMGIYIYIPPLTLEYLGGVRQEISEKYFTWPHEIYPPTCFWGFQKMWGGSSGCNILAQRWYGTPFHFEHTYIHSYFHTFIYIYIRIHVLKYT